MIEYNKLILNYLNNKTQTHQIEKQLCMIEAIEEILFSFDSLSPNATVHSISKRNISHKLKQKVAKSTLLKIFSKSQNETVLFHILSVIFLI